MVAMAAVIVRQRRRKKLADSTAMAADSNVVVLFDGHQPDGWRGYNWTRFLRHGPRRTAASKSTAGAGEAGARNGGDLIFGAEKFGNFELSFEWKGPKAATAASST